MKADPLAKNYDSLTPEERFRLILAASHRGDEAERERLANAGSHLTFSMPDHAPYAHAFSDMEQLAYVELLDVVTDYIHALACIGVAGNKTGELTLDCDIVELADEHNCDWLAQEQSIDLAWATGYRLRTKADGWTQFCEQMQVPPFLLWKDLPGFNRLQHTLAFAERASFGPEEFLRWLNSRRPATLPELTEISLTAATEADKLQKTFQRRVKWWRGDG